MFEDFSIFFKNKIRQQKIDNKVPKVFTEFTEEAKGILFGPLNGSKNHSR